MIDNKKRDHIILLLKQGKYEFTQHSIIDMIKQGYNWDQKMIVEWMLKGTYFLGKELFPLGKLSKRSYAEIKPRHKRIYCIHKIRQKLKNLYKYPKLIIIGILVKKKLLIIHVSPLNKGSRIGRIYSQKSSIK